MITTSQRLLIRASFEKLCPQRDRAGELFYQRLFALAPGLAPLFENTPIETQAGKLMQILAFIVDRLEQWPTLSTAIKDMGARHAGYGAQPDHYAVVGAALIGTLSNVLGADFSDDTEEAWAELYSQLSLLMEKGGDGR